MAMLSHFFVISPRGDTIINRSFRPDLTKTSADVFFRRVKQMSDGEMPPVFSSDGVIFVFLKRGGLFFVAVTQSSGTPAYCLELLQQMTKVFKDFCGILNEEAVRRNFILIYEIVDEILDFGYVQHTTTERLKHCVHNEAVLVEFPTFDKLGPASRSRPGALPIRARIVDGIPGISAGSGTSSVIDRFGTSFPSIATATSNPKTVPSNASHRPVSTMAQQASAAPGAAGLGGGPIFESSLGGTAVSSFFSSLARNTVLGNLGKRGTAEAPVYGNRNEVFVDILERITLVTNSSGHILNSSIDGCIQMKSYLVARPSLRLALNEDIVIRNEANGCSQAGRSGVPRFHDRSFTAATDHRGPLGRKDFNVSEIDDCNFHPCVDLSEFDSSRVLTVNPPDGEFIVMNYRITDEFKIPFLIKPVVEQTAATKLEVCIDLRAEIPTNHYGGNLVLTCPMPRTAVAVATEVSPKIAPQSVEFLQQERKVVWMIKKIQGGQQMSLLCRITLSQPLPTFQNEAKMLIFLRKEIGPISLNFEIPMYSVSNLQVRYLRILDALPAPSGLGPRDGYSTSHAPYRWVRYVTQSSSYICRL